MSRYIAKRLLLFVPTLLLASLLIFGAMRILPGDVAMRILADNQQPFTPQAYDQLRQQLGLNAPLPVQYGKWVWSMVDGQFGGISMVTQQPISQMIASRLPVTGVLALYTIVLTLIVSIPLGIVAAIYQDKWPDYVVRIFAIAGHSVPNFWVALVILLVASVYFQWAPPLIYEAPWQNPMVNIEKMIWPVLVLTWGFTGFLVRIVRSDVLEVLRQDYVRTARSKGLRERVILVRHVLRNALIPVVTVAGFYMGFLLSGTVILENIFGLPGIGQALIGAANQRDYPVIQSLTIMIVFFLLTVNLLVDLIYAIIDPRINYATQT